MAKLSVSLGITNVVEKSTSTSTPPTALSYLNNLLTYLGQLLTFTP
jgi:hypothetical protein